MAIRFPDESPSDAFLVAFATASAVARDIANHVVAGVPVARKLVDDYTRARGEVDRLVEDAAGSHTCPGEQRCLHVSHRMARQQ